MLKAELTAKVLWSIELGFPFLSDSLWCLINISQNRRKSLVGRDHRRAPAPTSEFRPGLSWKFPHWRFPQPYLTLVAVLNYPCYDFFFLTSGQNYLWTSQLCHVRKNISRPILICQECPKIQEQQKMKQSSLPAPIGFWIVILIVWKIVPLCHVTKAEFKT